MPRRLSVDLDYSFIGTSVEFLAAIERGDYLPHLLGDSGVAELARHPVIEWKLHNVREHPRRQSGGRSPVVRPKLIFDSWTPVARDRVLSINDLRIKSAVFCRNVVPPPL